MNFITQSYRAKKTLLVICFLAFAFNESKASLGETSKEIESRYGVPQSTAKGLSDRDYTATYQTSDLKIAVTFIDGKSQKEIFGKTDAKTALSKDEINALLKADAGDSQWDYYDGSSRYSHRIETPNNIVYRLINHAAWAEYSIVGGPHLSVWTDGYSSYRRALEK
ncbi:MAG: hypothetical protein WCD79_10915 [Chthoniobacteraceae bacterium]